MIPTRLDEWNLDAVLSVAASGIAENDLFDLKADLQPAEHQRKVVAAFANTRGGYLVFGVTNDRRVVGVSNDELPRDFGSKLGTGIEPSVEFRIGSAIPVSPGKNVFVVEIPRSSRVPHAVLQNGSWTFLKRLASGSNDPMSYEEIRLAFQDTDMKRSKLALVASELDLIEAIAGRVIDGVPEEFEAKNLYRWAWVTRYPTNLLDAILGDAYSLLAKDKDTWDLLGYVRDSVRVSNTYSEALSQLPFSAISGADEQKKQFQLEIRSTASKLREKAASAKAAIEKLLGPEV
ncbi:MAG: ATP-binding protein [Nitrospira sp.]|nr:MAG: ATP-binding protein [Nitrospira sp.]